MTQHVTVTFDSTNGSVRCQFGALQATFKWASLVKLEELQKLDSTHAKRALIEQRALEKFAALAASVAESVAQPA